MVKAVSTDATSNLILLESFSLEQKSTIPVQPSVPKGLLIYVLKRNDGKKDSYLVIQGAPDEDILSYLADSSPEIYEIILNYLKKESLFLDLKCVEAGNSNGPVDSPEIRSLLQALATITHFPKRKIDSSPDTGIVSVILAAGKGSRIHSKDIHKVCFPVAGRPAINRLLDQLESVGIHEHIVIAGEKGKQLVNEITEVRDGVTFVYQINQNGTGNAAKQAAYLLRSQNYNGNILVVLGDKVLEKSALQRLLDDFHGSNADLALMTAEKKIWPDAGRIVFDRKGQPADIVEKRDIQKMIISKRLLELKRKKPKTSSDVLHKEIMKEISSSRKARAMFPVLMECIEKNAYISLTKLEELIPNGQTQYKIMSDGETISYSGEELEHATPVSNAAVYLFNSDSFFKTIFSISSDNAQKEEYFTEIVRLLAEDAEKSWKIVSVPVKNRYEVMSYNNPEELLKIEEYYSEKESSAVSSERSYERIDVATREHALRPVEEWLHAIDNFGPATKHGFRKIYGENEDILQERRKVYLKTLQKFVKVYGLKKSVVIARSPGRANLMGRHVEHRGGYTNYMTINQEALLVAGLREDDVIDLHNIDSRQFRPRKFSVGSEVSRLPWDEWLNMIGSQTVHEILQSSRGDWSNYFRAAALRLQEKYKGRLLYGFNGVFSSNIPLAAGLSSSSAAVVSAAEVMAFINGLMFVPNDFVDLRGESEWFVGAKGESGDYAAMKFGEKGKIIHMGFQEVRIEKIIPFPENYRLIMLQSHQRPGKTKDSMQNTSEKMVAYEAAQAIVKAKYPEYRDRIKHFRDINTDQFGLKSHEIYDIILNIPEHISRNEIMNIILEDDKHHMEMIFSSHKEPAEGYETRNVALFGLSEIARAKKLAHLMGENNIEAAGNLMNISHDGDRVSRVNKKGEKEKYNNAIHDDYLNSLRYRLLKGDFSASLHLQPGGYGSSTPLIDEMVDVSLTINGVVGAQLSGSGPGGCIMALVKEDSVDTFLTTMSSSFYEKYDVQEKMVVCTPIAGSGILSI